MDRMARAYTLVCTLDRTLDRMARDNTLLGVHFALCLFILSLLLEHEGRVAKLMAIS